MTFSAGRLKGDGLLLLTAIIWGFAFVAQRSGMAVIGPFAYGAARAALGTLFLVPLLVYSKRRSARQAPAPGALSLRRKLLWVTLAGVVLFAGTSLQQVGLVSTTAGNAGFITGLYVVLVPVMAIFAGRASGLRIWIGALLAVAGLYILSVGAGFTMAPGDILELIGAFFWAGHILLINHLVSRMEALEIAVGQFTACAVFSLAAALIFEPAPFHGLIPAAIPILYGGPMSIGVAYTLQVVAQKTVHPAHASIILSMEALFAGIGGVLLLHEPLTLRLVVGGLLMLAGMITSQLERRPKPEPVWVEGQPAG
jgi:drug/metabolite transporter (DMT)-like permease